MTKDELKALDKQYVMPTYGRFDVAVASGEGAVVRDLDGREYIDFSSGIGVNSLGYANKAWLAAVTEQAGKLAHMSNLFYTEPCAKLARRLCESTGMSRVFFANSGAESNEGAIKLARKYSFDKYGLGRSTIVTLLQSFHGRTVTTLAATGQDVFHNYFFPFTEGFRYAKANDIDSVKAQLDGTVCAVMVEPVQGEGGVLPLEPDFIRGLKALCDENDLLFLCDEVQTGVGRTGTLFAFQDFGFLPDAVTFAKGIGGGLPLGGFLVGEKCAGVLGPGTHASTFGGNPVCCAGALAVLDALEGGVLAEVRQKGAYLREKIEAMGSPLVRGTRGKGLMIGVALRQGTDNKALAKELISAGVLVLTAGDALRLLPPLTITREEMDRGLTIMQSVLCK